MNEKPKIVCLCGSTKFKAEYDKANQEFTLKGCIVLSVGFFGHQMPIGSKLDDETKAKLDELHKRKIDLADYVFVINPGNYIGESTMSEIHYAVRHGKPVHYLCHIEIAPRTIRERGTKCTI
jgi:nucleoside 2-deoxyribosyltransferase